MHRIGLAGLLLGLAVGGCAHGSASNPADLLALPTCADHVVGVRSRALEEHGASDVRQRIRSSGWIGAQGRTEIVAVERDPQLVNTGAVARALVDYYPSDLRDRGLGGTVAFLVWIDPEGNLVRKQIAESARYPAFDRAAADVMSIMEFSPAATNTCRPAFWGELVVTFEVRR